MTISTFKTYKLTEANQLALVFKVSIIEDILSRYKKFKHLALDKAINDLIYLLESNQLNVDKRFFQIYLYI